MKSGGATIGGEARGIIATGAGVLVGGGAVIGGAGAGSMAGALIAVFATTDATDDASLAAVSPAGGSAPGVGAPSRTGALPKLQ